MEFNFFANSHVQFGPGRLARLPELIRGFGNTLLLITGAESFPKSYHWPLLLKGLEKKSIRIHHAIVKTEPSPFVIDTLVSQYQNQQIDVVAAIGGGSVIDAGKAVSAMMTKKDSIINYLEGVGNKIHDGKKLPFIAIPTTAGTGSEATKNAVISQVSRVEKKGFKKSLRHDNFMPDIAIVDPKLTLDCPPRITAACGMDALTQLLESLVSPGGSMMTDSLALGALEILGDSIIRASTQDHHDLAGRTKICYASYISGLTLANAGLGLVHGFAGVIGGLFKIPHGVVCGTLLCEVTRQNIERLIATNPKGSALAKYARAGHLLSPSHGGDDPLEGSRYLVQLLAQWTDQLKMPGLGSFGITPGDIDFIVSATGQKNNPVQLPKETLCQILQARG